MTLLRYIGRRIVVSSGLLFVASILVFLIVHLIPGDPAQVILGHLSTQESAEALRRELGLHRPLWEQYINWLTGVLTGDWGRSFVTNQPVFDRVAARYPRSLQIAVMSTILSVVISFPLALVAALNRNELPDYAAIFFSQVGVSIPSFWLGILLILVFAGYFSLFPTRGYVSLLADPVQSLRHAFLPALTIAFINAAIFTRYLRSELLEELGEDYVRTARAFGHPEQRVIWKYVLRNALIPTLTVMGIQFGYMMGGLVIVETVFTYPGLGLLLLEGLLSRDYPIIQMGLLVLAATFIIINLAVDIMYGVLDPRVRG